MKLMSFCGADMCECTTVFASTQFAKLSSVCQNYTQANENKHWDINHSHL